MATLFCGIDPGLHGAFAFLDVEKHTLRIYDMPVFEKNKKNHVDPIQVGAILNSLTPDLVTVEQVHSSPQMGVASSFSFGRSLGVVLGAVGALGVPISEVPPSVWKPRMGCTADKTQTASKATYFLPNCAFAWKLKKHVDRAEAALIALYAAVTSGKTVQTNQVQLIT